MNTTGDTPLPPVKKVSTVALKVLPFLQVVKANFGEGEKHNCVNAMEF